MKHVKKRVTLLMVLIMIVGALSACSRSSNSTSPTTEISTSSESESSSTNDSDTQAETTLPLTTEPITLTVFAGLDSNLTSITNDYNDNTFFQELEARTGVHLEFVTPASGEEKTNYNLMIASGQLADIITHNGYDYPEGLDAAVDDGYYMDLTPYLDTYLTDYNAARMKDDMVIKSTTTDAGRVVGFHIIYTEPQGPWKGLQVRKDWLDELGLEIPVTYSDWENMLTQFKEEKGAYAPLSIGANGYMETSHSLSAGFGVFEDFMNVNGSVVYGPITNNWRDYLTLMHDWYEKGLIDPDFMTSGGWQPDTAVVTSGQTGAWDAMYTMPSLYEAADPNMYIVPVTSPVITKGDDLHIRRETGYVGNSVTISADCKYPEIAMKLLNYLYSDEGSLLCNYGIEGDTFEYDANGKPVLTDKISKNSDYSMSQAQAFYLMPPSRFGALYDWTRELSAVPEKDVLSYDVWGGADDDYILPARITYTSTESKELAQITADVTTLMNEQSVKFITGVLDIEKEWDAYVSQIQSMNIEHATEIKQAALDRFNAR